MTCVEEESINETRKLTLTPTAMTRLPTNMWSALTASSSAPARPTSRRCLRAAASLKSETMRLYDCGDSKQGWSI